MPFLDNGAELVSGDVHTVEVGEAVESFDFLNLDLHLSPSLFVAISVQISKRNLKHTTFQAVGGDLYQNQVNINSNERKVLTLTSSSVARSKGGVSNVEHGGYVDVVPFLLGE